MRFTTGNLRAVQILLGHTKIESTVRYLGVDVEDALTLAEGTEVQDIRDHGRLVRNGRLRNTNAAVLIAGRGGFLPVRYRWRRPDSGGWFGGRLSPSPCALGR